MYGFLVIFHQHVIETLSTLTAHTIVKFWAFDIRRLVSAKTRKDVTKQSTHQRCISQIHFKLLKQLKENTWKQHETTVLLFAQIAITTKSNRYIQFQYELNIHIISPSGFVKCCATMVKECASTSSLST